MIFKTSVVDTRYPMGSGAGSDAIHRDPVYSYAVTQLHDDSGLKGSGLLLHLVRATTLFVKLHNSMQKNYKEKI